MSKKKSFHLPCKLCGETKKLVRAHIIPRAFYPRTNDPDHQMSLIGPDPKSPHSRRPKGVYDPQILCAECDNGLGVWDNYAYSLLKDFPAGWTVYGSSKEPEIGCLDVFDYDQLVLFMAATIWRAHISEVGLFINVQLEDAEEDFFTAVRTGAVDSLADYSFFISRFAELTDLPFLNPVKRESLGVNGFVFYVGNYIFEYFLSPLGAEHPLHEFILQPGEALKVIIRSFRGSEEEKVIRRYASEHRDWKHS